MRIVLLSRFPRFDKLRWKEDLLLGLDRLGARPTALVYDSTSLADQLEEGVKRYGIGGVAGKLGSLLGKPRTGAPSGLGRRLERVAEEIGVPVHRVASHNDERAKALLESLAPDVLVLLGTRIIRKHVLAIPRLGTLNPHYGPLPDVRGMNATEWALWLGKPLGVTIHTVVPEVDQGGILAFEPFAPEPGDDLAALRRKCQNAACRALLEVVGRALKGSLDPRPQSPAEGKQYFSMNRALREKLEASLRAAISSGRAGSSSRPRRT